MVPRLVRDGKAGTSRVGLSRLQKKVDSKSLELGKATPDDRRDHAAAREPGLLVLPAGDGKADVN